MDWLNDLIIEPIEVYFNNFLLYLPTLTSAFIIFILGIILSVLLSKLLSRILRFSKLDRVSQKLNIPEALLKGGIKDTLSGIIGKIFGWTLFVLFTLISLQAMKLKPVQLLVERLVLYLPYIFTALLIMLFGYLLGNFIGRAVLITCVNAGIKTAGIISRFAKYAIFFFALSVALEQLGIGKDTVLVTFAITFGGVVLALAISFGLGGKDLAKGFMEKRLNGEKDEIDYL
ncbi:hypothetical protein F9K33_07615 [bacterium]|nr:MAG: hypothetical protein F9K33_07615 [bacterium]